MRLFLLANDPHSQSIESFLALYPRVENLEIHVYNDFKEVRKKTSLKTNPIQSVPVLYDSQNNLVLKSVEAIYQRLHSLLDDPLFKLSNKGKLTIHYKIRGSR